jgi:hypothetical protein
MPLLSFDLIEGRSEAELKALLDAAHRAMLAAFKVPERDRYQIVQEHKRSHMIIEDTGLGIERSDKIVFLQVTTRSRDRHSIACSARRSSATAGSRRPTWWCRWWKTSTRTGRPASAARNS